MDENVLRTSIDCFPKIHSQKPVSVLVQHYDPCQNANVISQIRLIHKSFHT